MGRRMTTFGEVDDNIKVSEGVRIVIGIAANASIRRGDSKEQWVAELKAARRVIEHAIAKEQRDDE